MPDNPPRTAELCPVLFVQEAGQAAGQAGLALSAGAGDRLDGQSTGAGFAPGPQALQFAVAAVEGDCLGVGAQ
ncbi:hypothetical protein [Streptomyces sp. NRRL S-646]|uniref:hypothetical protein n=1 Tax=Streptomyces sp. NRRL S-646 TaxID=1463917 RepID=UPI0013314604|nr:hypothetical protein [Streptomyces sp. NRRL S-646]